MADQGSATAKSMVERIFDRNLQEEFSRRRSAFAEAIGEVADTASDRAAEGWRDAEPIRRDAARAGREALKWGSRTWRRQVRPGLLRMWSNRAAAIGTATAAVPVARELIDDAAVRMGIKKRREQRHWGTFFLGLLIGAAAGVIAALLTAPKAGRQMRDELAVTARDTATRARDVAARAREAASSADWAPIFQRSIAEHEGNGELNGQAEVEMELSEETKAASSRKRARSAAPVDEPDQEA
jgi:gas vesicle protein